MDVFPSVDPNTSSAQWPTDGSDDHDLDVALLMDGREAFAGFTNFAALQIMRNTSQHAPWRRK